MSSIAKFGEEHIFKQCANCPSYNWPQPVNVDGYKRCAGCKIFHYCSKTCQTEHWLKVHKFHCKYLRGSKELKESTHESSLCRFCQNEINVGSEMMSKDEVSVLGCPFTKGVVYYLPFMYGENPSPVKLGEITGTFPSKFEHTVSTMHRVIYKMSLISKYKLAGVQNLLEDIEMELHYMRMCTRASYCVLTPKEVDGKRFFFPMGKLVSLISSLREILSKAGLINNGEVRLIDTLLLLCQLLKIVLFKAVPVPNSFSSGAYVNVTEPELFDKWEKVLQKLDSDNWTYDQLISILLPSDQSSHRCFGCGHVVNARSVSFFEDVFNVLIFGGDERSKFFFTTVFPIGFFICKSSLMSPCIVKLMFMFRNYAFFGRSEEEKNAVSNLYWCDNCFKSTVNVHRCSACLTKLYCGTACRDDDWPIHKQVCVKEERKRKGSKNIRMGSVNDEEDEWMRKCFQATEQLATAVSGQFN